MSVKLAFTRQVSGIGLQGSQNVSVVDNQGASANPTILAAQPATLTTRTSNTAGTLTMTNALHGITTGQRIDIYWTGGQAYGATVGTVSGTSVPFTGAQGTSLPIATTVVGVGIPVSTPFNITGNNVQGFAFFAPVAGYFVFNNGSADVYAKYLVAGSVYGWDTSSPDANPLAGLAPTVIWISHSVQSGSQVGMQAAAAAH